MSGPLAVVGAGAWGTALANAAARAGGGRVLLWGRNPDAMAVLAATRTNERALPGVELAPEIEPTADAAAVGAASAVLLVVPAQAVRGALAGLGSVLAAPDLPIIVCAKGIERGSGAFPCDIVAELCPRAVPAVLSGPSFAADVARDLPTAVVLASAKAGLARKLAARLSGPALRVYHGTDVRGVEIGGAAKNVLAIACGIVAGRGLGESARAALVARGFAELARFARAHGARAETLMGLSGLGDLVLTCGSAQSRNFAFGEALGRGEVPATAAAGKLVEGAFTAPVLVDKAARAGVDMPIAQAVAAILDGAITVNEAVDMLMMRPLKAEA
ncbi:NAD(P)H-dependent glycerol-3-phosphate dehydrogenase [Chelatococcus reniformis]|uniref:Glycerol-3-phosphate dehydrogenase [NAD(P)+] n=1 Tax=Chelatococcus reniformis TaxID=1494448 RepID=A0A916X726_9HYPH|nr:NAD(P)H-dependent glycerol-3-phosphate dehydrogenase [Chelatococcus reniformis]GGC49943.1 glycerol-3-phosphate dehydrogenase [NAD(P)+] [Chelatococcus reniformis]